MDTKKVLKYILTFSFSMSVMNAASDSCVNGPRTPVTLGDFFSIEDLDQPKQDEYIVVPDESKPLNKKRSRKNVFRRLMPKQASSKYQANMGSTDEIESDMCEWESEVLDDHDFFVSDKKTANEKDTKTVENQVVSASGTDEESDDIDKVSEGSGPSNLSDSESSIDDDSYMGMLTTTLRYLLPY